MSSGTGKDPDRRLAITRAALLVFGRYGYGRTSMADIAEAAGVSRPALYLHFENKAEIFHAAAQTLVDDALEHAEAAAAARDSLAARIDAALQGFYGDLYGALHEFPHGEDLVAAASTDPEIADLVKSSEKRLGDLFRSIVDDSTAGNKTAADDLIDLLVLAPHGLKPPETTPAQYRRRLSALADAGVASLESA